MISTDIIYTCFTSPDERISHFSSSYKPFDFKSRNSRKLVVTIGASWSWGEELVNRLDSCYGNLVSEKLDADWLNLSVPGAGNHYISQLYLDLVNYIKKHNTYEHILCVIVMTETGRDFNGWFDRNVDYAFWLRKNVKKSDDYYKFLEFINDFSIDQILANNNISNLELMIGFDCVNPSSTKKLENLLLPNTWLEVYTKVNLTDKCFILSPFIFEKLNSIFDIEWSLDKNLFKIWQIEQIDKANKRLELIENQYFSNYHPKEPGHEAWAQYILSMLHKK